VSIQIDLAAIWKRMEAERERHEKAIDCLNAEVREVQKQCKHPKKYRRHDYTPYDHCEWCDVCQKELR
jgi:uncharacterized protein (DUF169 family)